MKLLENNTLDRRSQTITEDTTSVKLSLKVWKYKWRVICISLKSVRLSIVQYVFVYFPRQAPPNFLRAAALAEYKRPVVVIPNEDHQEEEVETQPEFRDAPQVPHEKLLNGKK